MQTQARSWHKQGKSIGLVPTMGGLHAGHLSLISLAKSLSDVVVVSLFVNPTQFSANEDFTRYPRTIEKDRQMCLEAGVSVIFCPSIKVIYPRNFSTWVSEEKLSLPLCGRFRPGHFRGVTTIVAKLFNATLPDIAIFGQKDAQQAMVIKRMTVDMNFPIEIIIAPIIREPDGLAMSSRNSYLGKGERQRAGSIYRGIRQAELAFHNGERNPRNIEKVIKVEIQQNQGLIDYVECVDASTLKPINVIKKDCLVAIAAWFGNTRLIDNCLLSVATQPHN